jgi:hypothetical protein
MINSAFKLLKYKNKTFSRTGLHVFCQGSCCISPGVQQNQILLRTVNSPYDYLMAHNLSFLCVASRVFAPVSKEEKDGAKKKTSAKSMVFCTDAYSLLFFYLHSLPPSPFNISSPARTSTYTFVQKTALCARPALCSQILCP